MILFKFTKAFPQLDIMSTQSPTTKRNFNIEKSRLELIQETDEDLIEEIKKMQPEISEKWKKKLKKDQEEIEKKITIIQKYVNYLFF